MSDICRQEFFYGREIIFGDTDLPGTDDEIGVSKHPCCVVHLRSVLRISELNCLDPLAGWPTPKNCLRGGGENRSCASGSYSKRRL